MGRRGLPDELKGAALLLASRRRVRHRCHMEIDGGATALTKGRMSDVGPVRAETPTGISERTKDGRRHQRVAPTPHRN